MGVQSKIKLLLPRTFKMIVCHSRVSLPKFQCWKHAISSLEKTCCSLVYAPNPDIPPIVASNLHKLILSLAMTGAPPQKPRTPRQPKLRSSCDRCGAAKLKCDRGQPQCGRCIPLGLECVYGVSRKMGKPPRERLRISEVPGIPRRPDEYTGSIGRDRPDNNSSGANGSVTNSIELNSGPLSSVNNVPLAWGAGDSYNNNLMTSADAFDAMQSDLIGSSISDFTSLEFDDDMLDTNFQTVPISTLGTPEIEGYSTSGAETTASQTQIDENVSFDSASMPSAGGRGHDCSREAYHILGSLCLLNPNMAHCIPGSASSSASATASTTHRVPFDQILRLNRESSERLGRLLTCYCARWPHQALLYASLISLILTWYEEAAGCTQKVSWSPVATVADTVSRHRSPSGSQSPWSNTALCTVDTGGPSTPTYTGATALAVAPTHMAMGSFNIDDQQVQAALRIQLLLGELRRTGSLIDLYRSSSGVDEFTFSGVDGLYKNLSSWLKRENSRIENVMRSRLEEAST